MKSPALSVPLSRTSAPGPLTTRSEVTQRAQFLPALMLIHSLTHTLTLVLPPERVHFLLQLVRKETGLNQMRILWGKLQLKVRDCPTKSVFIICFAFIWFKRSLFLILCVVCTVYIFKALLVVKTECNCSWQVCYGIMMDLHDDWWQPDSLISCYFSLFIYKCSTSALITFQMHHSLFFALFLKVNICLSLHPENSTDFILFLLPRFF